MDIFKGGLLICGGLVSLCTMSQAELKLPAFFSDNMVLQQETGSNVWGWAEAGQQITVNYLDRTEISTANKNGKWMVTFNGLKASKKGSTMKVSTGDENLELNEVVVGEVWIASGQSNMEWVIGKTNSKKTEENANDSFLRIYQAKNVTAAAEQKDFKGKWETVKAGKNLNFTAVGYEFGKSLREKLDVPVGIIECAWAGKRVEAFMSDSAIKSLPEAKPLMEKKEKAFAKWSDLQNVVGKKSKKAKRTKKKGGRNPNLSTDYHSTIYNGMIAPITGYSARGVIWYQGESNSKDETSIIYGELLEGLIQDWRKQWGSNLSFYYVQLANYGKGTIPGWVNVQDEMRRLLDDEDMQDGNIGMATTNDIGNATNIHPLNKKDVAIRLARWALNKDYKMLDVVVSGPLYQSHIIKEGEIEITFNYTKGLKTRDGQSVGSFEIAGSDGKWIAADAKIVEDKVIVSSESVKSPIKARYAWSLLATGANLVNAEGLPTSCFITK